MLGDRPCPICRRILGRRYDPWNGEILPAYTCSSCGKDWEICPHCRGVIVEMPKPVDLFTSRVLEFFRICSSCQQEPPKKAG
jgi:hypothetical protein